MIIHVLKNYSYCLRLRYFEIHEGIAVRTCMWLCICSIADYSRNGLMPNKLT